MVSEMSAEAGSADLHSLTLLVSTQRSGSTLLGRDIESLGGLGSPREHFRGFEAQAKLSRMSENDVVERLTLGVEKSARGVTAVKLQVQQLGSVCEAISGERLPPSVKAVSTVVDWARERFDRVLLIVLVRNALDIAISRVIAHETGTYLSTKPVSRVAGGPLPLIDDLNAKVLNELETVLRHRAILKGVAAKYSDFALLLTYDELTGQVEETTRRLVTHAHEHGFEPQGDTVTRKLEKLISSEQADSIRESFLDHLRNEPGI